MNAEDLAFWLSWCIEEYSFEKGSTASEMLSSLEKNGVIDYLIENAEILHTQGKNFIISSIDRIMVK